MPPCPASRRPRRPAPSSAVRFGLAFGVASISGSMSIARATPARFSAPFVASNIPSNPAGVAIGNLNRDSWNDLVSVSQGQLPNSTRSTIPPASGGGVLNGPRTEQTVPETPLAIFAREVTGDGILDVIIRVSAASVYRGLGNGTLPSGYSGESPVGAGSARADPDGEGALDLVGSGAARARPQNRPHHRWFGNHRHGPHLHPAPRDVCSILQHLMRRPGQTGSVDCQGSLRGYEYASRRVGQLAPEHPAVHLT